MRARRQRVGKPGGARDHGPGAGPGEPLDLNAARRAWCGPSRGEEAKIHQHRHRTGGRPRRRARGGAAWLGGAALLGGLGLATGLQAEPEVYWRRDGQTWRKIEVEGDRVLRRWTLPVEPGEDAAFAPQRRAPLAAEFSRTRGRVAVTRLVTSRARSGQARLELHAEAYGRGAAELALFAVATNGRLQPLERRQARHATGRRFRLAYPEAGTVGFELRLYDQEGRLLARTRRDLERPPPPPEAGAPPRRR